MMCPPLPQLCRDASQTYVRVKRTAAVNFLYLPSSVATVATTPPTTSLTAKGSCPFTASPSVHLQLPTLIFATFSCILALILTLAPPVLFTHVHIALPPIQQSRSHPTELISLLPCLLFTTDNHHQLLHSCYARTLGTFLSALSRVRPAYCTDLGSCACRLPFLEPFEFPLVSMRASDGGLPIR